MGKQSREKLARRLVRRSPEGEGGSLGGWQKPNLQSQTGLEKACLFIIEWGTYVILFSPLIVATDFFFPFVAPKTTFFRMMVEIIFAAYLILVFTNGKYRPRINPLMIAVTLFLAVFILASFLGVNLGRSVWSTYERMTGVWTMLHLYTFFIVLANCFKKRENWERIFAVSALVGVFLSLYILRGNQLSTRGGGTIGNTSFMAAYLLFDVFFAIILFFSNFLRKGGWALFLQIFSGISLLIMLPVLFKSSARGAIAFFEAGLALMALGYLLFSGKKILRRAGLAIVLISLLIGIFVFISPPDFLTSKINSLFQEMKPRFAVWGAGYSAWQERPLLGWGPENFNAAFLKYFNPCMFLGECGGEIWFDRVHNIVLDTLAATGLIGFLSYLTIFSIVIGSLLRILPKMADKRNVLLPVGMIALLLAYFGQNFLVFDMINTYLMFFLSLSFAAFLVQEKKEDEKITDPKKINGILAVSIILMTMVFLWWGNIKPLIAGQNIIKMVTARNLGESASYFQKSLDSFMNKYEAREQFAQILTGASFQSQSLSDSEKEGLLKILALGEEEMEKSAKENYLDFRPHLFLGKLYSGSYQVSGNPEELKKALYYLEKAITLSSTNQQGYWYLGEVKFSEGKKEEAVALFQKAADLEPRLLKAHWYLTLAYKFSDNYQSAKEKLLELQKMGYDWNNNSYELKQAIDILQYFKDDAELLPFYQKVVQLQPDDIQMRFALAATYANLGQFDEAREAAEQIKKIKPEVAADVDKFIESLPQ